MHKTVLLIFFIRIWGQKVIASFGSFQIHGLFKASLKEEFCSFGRWWLDMVFRLI